MPRRNAFLLLVTLVVSLICYQRAHSRFGRMFDTFSIVWQNVETKYVEPVDDRKLLEGALEGTIRALDDPYSGYFPPQEAAESRASLDQEFGGIGIEVSFDRDTKMLTVGSPLVGSPAYNAGILPGDKILKINDESTEGFQLADTVKRLRGKAGESVRLTILHEGQEDPIEVEIKRAKIQTDSVLGDNRNADGTWNFMLPGKDKIGYIRVITFGKRTADELKAALEKLDQEGMQGLILDVRNDQGGLLYEALATCKLFVKEGRIVSTRGRDGVIVATYDADGTASYTNFPMAVLANQFSASASEIVAACLQDHHRAIVVGQRTYGKGTVQSVIPIEGGKSELRLTIASYWRPSGVNIHRAKGAKPTDVWGVEPNPGYDVKLSDKELVDLNRHRRQRDVLRLPGVAIGKPDDPQADDPFLDPQLKKAFEYVVERAESRGGEREVGRGALE
jgi:carboxyl-terminal processing protease